MHNVSPLIAGMLKEAPCDYHPENHTYTSKANMKLWPGVTSIGDNLSKPFLIPWAAKEVVKHLADKQDFIKNCTPAEYLALLDDAKGAHRRKAKDAADAGTRAHEWIDNYILWRLNDTGVGELPEDERVLSAVQAFLEWETRNHVIWLSGDLVVGSAEHEFGGKLDGLATVNGIPTLIDFKTSNQISKDYFIQTAGYHIALKEMGVEMWQRLILRVPKDGSAFEALIVPTPLDLDISAFLALRQIQRWQSFVGNQDNGISDERGFIKVENKNVLRI